MSTTNAVAIVSYYREHRVGNLFLAILLGGVYTVVLLVRLFGFFSIEKRTISAAAVKELSVE